MPSETDKFEGAGCRIKVNPSGKYFSLYNKGDISEINIVDIASAISRQCRFTGHLLPHVGIYSVAEHSVLVSHILEQMGADAETVFYGLMHDACEAYLSDIAAPFKGEIGNYHAIENMVFERVAKRYNLKLSEAKKKVVKTADWYALFIEARQLVVPDEEELKQWLGYDEFGEDSVHFARKLGCWDSFTGRIEFLARFAALTDRRLDK